MMKFVRWALLIAIVSRAGAADARYLYIAYCNEVSKIEASTGREVWTLELATRTHLIPSESPRTAFCDIDSLSYDPVRHIAIVEANDRYQRVYRRLLFSLPAFRLISSSELKRKWHEDGDEEPETKISPRVRLPGMVASGLQEGWLDLAGYHTDMDLTACTAYGQGKLLLSDLRAEAGGRVILKASCTEGTRYFVTSISGKQIVPLELPGDAEHARLSLTSDGRYLLAEGQTTSMKIGSDKAWLIDLQTGKVVQQWSDPRLVDSAFLGFADNGLLLFAARENFVLKTGRHFQPTAMGNAFFADR